MIIGVVCVDCNWSIGRNNDLLFHLPKDLKAFKQQTDNSIVFCGYNTLLSFPGSKSLKGRSTICLCPVEVERDDCFCIHDFNEALKLVKEISKTTNVYVIGGGMMYNSMLPYYDEVYVTKVQADGKGTVFFPNLDEDTNFELSERSENVEDNGYTINFCTYKKVANCE